MFLPLGSHPLANGFLRKEDLGLSEAMFPLDVYACLDCGLIQVSDNIPAGFFRHYVYVPSASDVMRQHFAEMAGAVARRFLHSPQALTVDIGCNDGLFLKSLANLGKRTLGVDPATNIVEMATQQGLEVVNEYFTPEIAGRILNEYGPAAVMVTTNTFHHIGDLDSFSEGVRLLLDDAGVFVIEVPHALELIEGNEFDGIYHEHVSQMTVKSLVDLFRRFDMEVFDIEKLEVHGGSMRAFIRKGRGNGVSGSVQQWIARELDGGLCRSSTYDAFRERVQQNKEITMRLLTDLKQQKKTLVGYGASARGNTLLNYYGIGTDLLDCIVDRNGLKRGLYSPGMHIPVFGIERIAQDMPDYLFVIAWNFASEIMHQQDEFRSRGGKFILPIPQAVIVN
jgi:SAM-dependent methyltransferase